MADLPATIGPYQILGVLGKGGMGVVYRGQHQHTQELAAIKTVFGASPTLMAGIRREIRAASQIRHPGVVRILGHGAQDGRPWYAMELLRGEPFADLLKEARKAPAPSPESLAETESVASDVETESVASDTETESVASGDHTVTLTETEAPDATPDADAGNAGPGDTFSTAVGTPSAMRKSQSPAAKATVERALFQPDVRNRLLALLRDVCAPLSFMHGAGLVHRDLKPDNIFVETRGTPVLVDFGIVGGFGGSQSRETLAAEGRVMGTVQYMAPEQVLGEFVDGRTDLYALGCIMYECLTGRPPFHGGDVRTVLARHLYQPPVPPSMRAPRVRPELDELVLALLAKQPGQRLGYAEDVAARLQRALGAHPAARPAEWSQPLPRPHSYLYRPAFAGRAGSMQVLGQALEQCRLVKRGGLAIIHGERGVGKTRLAMEIAREAVKKDVQVITGQCQSLGARLGAAGAPVSGAPLHPLRKLLQTVADRCQAKGSKMTARVLGPHARVLLPYAPELTNVPGLADYPSPPAADAKRARQRVYRAVTHVLRALASDKPLLLVIDDIQWADELTLGCLHHLAENQSLDERACLLICTSVGDQQPTQVDELIARPGVLDIGLARLDHEGVCAMAAGMLGLTEVPADIEDYLARASSGNPFFVAEYLRASVDAGMLHRDPEGTWRFAAGADSVDAQVGLPRTLAKLIERRLRGLPGRARELLTAASVLGPSMTSDMLLGTAQMLDNAGLDALHLLRKRQFLEDGGAHQLRFIHGTIREHTYELIPVDERRALHRRAAQVIEARHFDSPNAASMLGQHWSRAANHERAFGYFVRAAEHARETYANEQAAAMYRAAIAEAEAVARDAAGAALTPAMHQLYEELGDVLLLGGDRPRTEAAYRRSLEKLGSGQHQARARAWRKIGGARQASQEEQQTLAALARAEQALSASPHNARDDEWWREWIEIRIMRCTAYYFAGDQAALAEAASELQPVVEARGSFMQRARFFQTLVQRNLRTERYLASHDTVRYAELSLRGYERTDDPVAQATARFTYAAVLLWNGALSRAESEILRVLEAAERLGDVPLQASSLAYASVIFRRQRDVHGTSIFARKTAMHAEPAGIDSYLAVAKANLGWVAWREGAREKAVELCEQALAMWADAGVAYPFQWLALLPLLAMADEVGDRAAVCAHARALLSTGQRRLPESLTEVLQAVAETPPAQNAGPAAIRVVTEAKTLGYL